MKLPAQSQAFLKERFGQAQEDLKNLISVPSVTGDLVETERALDLLLNQGARLGFATEKILGGRMGIIEIGEGPETIGILAHVDVVPPGPGSLWSFDPYSGKTDGGYIYGRGAMDMKGPTIASLYGMAAAAASGSPLRKRIRMIVGTQEEGVWEDMEAYCGSYPLPDYGFTPDGEFPVTNREKGYADVSILFPLNGAEPGGTANSVSGGPSSELLTIHGGESANTVPEECSAILAFGDGSILDRIADAGKGEKWDPALRIGVRQNRITSTSDHAANGGTGVPETITVTVTGKATHSSRPENGVNALSAMASLLTRALLPSDPAIGLFHFIARHFHGDTTGKALGFSGIPEPPSGEEFGETAVSPTLLRTTDRGCELVVNIRTVYGTTRSLIQERFSGCAERYGFTFDVLNYQDALLVERNRSFLEVFNESYEQISGRSGGFILAHGTSYAKAMPGIVCWGPVFPGEEDRCHEVDERMSLENLRLCSLIYGDALYRLCVSERSFK